MMSVPIRLPSTRLPAAERGVRNVVVVAGDQVAVGRRRAADGIAISLDLDADRRSNAGLAGNVCVPEGSVPRKSPAITLSLPESWMSGSRLRLMSSPRTVLPPAMRLSTGARLPSLAASISMRRTVSRPWPAGLVLGDAPGWV